MKIAFIVCLLALSSMTLAQVPQEVPQVPQEETPVAPNTMEICMTDVKNNIKYIKELAPLVAELKITKIISHISKIKKIISTTAKSCKSIKKEDAMSYIFEHASEKQRECMGVAFGAMMSLNVLKEDLSQRQYKQFLSDFKNFVENMKNAKTACL